MKTSARVVYRITDSETLRLLSKGDRAHTKVKLSSLYNPEPPITPTRAVFTKSECIAIV